MTQESVLLALGFAPDEVEAMRRPRFRGRWFAFSVVSFLAVSMIVHPGTILDEALWDIVRVVKATYLR